MKPHPIILVCIMAGACGPADPEPNYSFDVTVVGTTTDCTTSTTGYQDKFRYDLYYTGFIVDLYVDDIYFATGGVTGCSVQYESTTWLEERDNGAWLRWSLQGEALAQGAAGGCDIEEDLDWYGTETITVDESGDETVLAGCTYELEVSGTFVPAE